MEARAGARTGRARDGRRVQPGRAPAPHGWTERHGIRLGESPGPSSPTRRRRPHRECPVHEPCPANCDDHPERRDPSLAYGRRRLIRSIRVRGKALPKDGAVSPSGKLVVTFGPDRFARVYSLVTGSLVGRLPNRGLVHCAAFSPSGSLLMTCSHEGVVRTWSTATLRQVRVLRGPKLNSAIEAGSFSPNGVLVAAAVVDGTARVWEAPTGQQIGVMFGHANPVTAVGFSTTGRRLQPAAPTTWPAHGSRTENRSPSSPATPAGSIRSSSVRTAVTS